MKHDIGRLIKELHIENTNYCNRCSRKIKKEQRIEIIVSEKKKKILIFIVFLITIRKF